MKREKANTPIQKLGTNLYIKRDDLFPYSFGGNKARKGILFFEEIDKGDYDCVVTYGSSKSNHCRVIANLAAQRKMECYIISPQEQNDVTFNSRMISQFDAKIINVPTEKVSEEIEKLLSSLKEKNRKPYFIMGGGHGNIGVQAYVNCYEEIKEYEKENNLFFDYIFLASGTGTTQAGLVVGKLKNDDNREIIGISIARKNPRGRDIVVESVKEYLCDYDDNKIQDAVKFIDTYTSGGYGIKSDEISNVIKEMMINHGINFDATYTGKAFLGMKHYIEENKITDKKILFIHTGGTPLFFDYLLEDK